MTARIKVWPEYDVDGFSRMPIGLSRKNRALWLQWQEGEYSCNGTTKRGDPCGNGTVVRNWERGDEFWPGVTDRCRYHIDEVARRDRDLARIAKRSGAADVEALQPAERRKEIHRATQATRPRVKRSDPDPVESTSADDKSALGRVSSNKWIQLELPLGLDIDEVRELTRPNKRRFTSDPKPAKAAKGACVP